MPVYPMYASVRYSRATLRHFLLVFFAVCLVCSLSLAQPVSSSASREYLSQAPTIELEFLTISLQPFFNDYINDLIAAYEEQNPNVRVRWIDQPPDAVQQRLLASLAAGTPSDVVNLNVPMVLAMAEQGALRDLEPIISQEARARYFDAMFDSFRLGDRQFGVPWYIAPAVVAYNEDIFRQADLDPEQPLPDLEALIAAAVQIKDQTGMYGFMPNVSAQLMLYRFLEAGLPVLSDDGFEAVFNSDAHVALLERYVQLFQDDYFPEDTMRRGYVGATELYSAGQLGMLITGPQFLLRVRNDSPEVYANTRIAPYPAMGGNAIHAPLMGLAVPQGVANPEAALDFALFVTNDANQLAFSRQVTIFPSTQEAAADPFFLELPETPSAEDFARNISALQLPFAADLTAALNVPNPSDLFGVFRNNIEEAFFGQKSPREALDDAVAFWNSRL